VLGGGPDPKGKGLTKKATLTESYERLYIETGERYDVGLNGSHIGDRPWAVDSLGGTNPFTPRRGRAVPR